MGTRSLEVGVLMFCMGMVSGVLSVTVADAGRTAVNVGDANGH